MTLSYEVIQVNKGTLEKIKYHYISSLKENPPQGAVFSAKTSGCTITAYKSGKILFQGKDAAAEAGKWQKGAVSSAKKTAKPASRKAVDNHSYQPPANLPGLVLLGSDETGTGDYFGPMTVVCAHLSKEQLKTVESWGIRDSKMINDTTIREIAPKLSKECTYSLLVLHNEKYNDLQEKGMNQGQMKALLHHQAITNVMKKCAAEGLDYDGVLIDQFVQPARYFDYLKSRNQMWSSEKPLYFATKAENLHPAVAAASVLARYSFLKQMAELEKKIGLPLPKGAGPGVDAAARRILKEKGKDTLYSCTKWHFANTGKAFK